MADLDHFVAWFVEQLVRFGSSFHRSGFTPERPFRNLVFGYKFDQVGHHPLAHCGGGCGVDAGQPMAEPVDGSLEARVLASHCFPAGHQSAQEVVGDDVDKQFAPDHGGAATGEHGHAEGGLEIVDEQLHLPARQVEGADFRCGHFLQIKHGACELEFARPEAGSGIHGDGHDPYRDAVWHFGVVGSGHPFRPDVGFPPAFQPVALAELGGTGVGFADGVDPHDDLNAPLPEEIQGEPAAEAAVRHDGVTGTHMPPELAAEVALAAAERGGGRIDPNPGGEIEEPNEAHDGEAAALFL